MSLLEIPKFRKGWPRADLTPSLCQRLLFALILIGSVLLLSAASESAEPSKPKVQNLIQTEPDTPKPYSEQSIQNSEKQKDNASRKNGGTTPTASLINPAPTNYLQQATAYCTKKPKTEEDKWLKNFACDVKITDVTIALFTVALAFVTCVLAFIGFWQVAVSRNTAQRQLRAYVFVDSAEIIGTNAGDTPRANLIIKNSGQTPAYNLSEMGGIAMGVSFETLPPPTGSNRMSKASLPAGARTSQFHIAPKPLAPEAVAALHAGEMTLWVYGRIHYRDAFKKKRFTKYRFQIGGAVGINSNLLAICEEGNEEN